VAVKTAHILLPQTIFFTAAGDACFCVAVAAFQNLIACGSTHAFPFLIACGGRKFIVCGGKWTSFMPGYKKQMACGSNLLRLMHSWKQGLFLRKEATLCMCQVLMFFTRLLRLLLRA